MGFAAPLAKPLSPLGLIFESGNGNIRYEFQKQDNIADQWLNDFVGTRRSTALDAKWLSSISY